MFGQVQRPTARANNSHERTVAAERPPTTLGLSFDEGTKALSPDHQTSYADQYAALAPGQARPDSATREATSVSRLVRDASGPQDLSLASPRRANHDSPSRAPDAYAAARLSIPGGRAARRGATPTQMKPKTRPNAIGFVGMNEGAPKELDILRKNSGGSKVIGVIGDMALQDQLNPENFEGTKAERKKAADQELEIWAQDFFKQIGVKDDKLKGRLMTLLKSMDRKAVDEMAGMIRLFVGAEQGQYTLERLVISGHSTGDGVWGDENGIIQERGQLGIATDLRRLAAAFPTVASQVQDVMFSACWSVGYIQLCAQMFPNLKTCWGYTGASPTTKQGAPRDQKAWERSTRDERVPTKAPKRGSHAIWVKGKGLLAGDVNRHDFTDLLEAAMRSEGSFPSYWSGDLPRSSGGPLRQHYNTVQMVMNHRKFRTLDQKLAYYKLERAELANLQGTAFWQERKSQLLRLRLFHEIRKKFSHDHAKLIAQVSGGLSAAKSSYQLPNFTAMTRKETRLFIEGAKPHLSSIEGGSTLYAEAEKTLWQLK